MFRPGARWWGVDVAAHRGNGCACTPHQDSAESGLLVSRSDSPSPAQGDAQGIETQLVKSCTLQPGLADGVCTDGATSKERCGGHLNDSAIHCITYAVDNTKICGVMLVDGATSLSQGGDSGGPVYSYNNRGAEVLAQGIVSVELTGSNGRQTVSVPISTFSGALGTTVSTTGNYH